jgi:adenylate kinase
VGEISIYREIHEQGESMAGKKVIVTGVPGVGKTTVITGALQNLKEQGIEYQSINFGSFMFDVAKSEQFIENRDQMRTLDREVQKRLQQYAAQAIAKIEGNVLIDTHASVKTPKGYLAGLPEWVLRGIMPDVIVLVETDDDQILMRRLGDETRARDKEGARAISEHQQFNRSIAAAYTMMTGCTVKIVTNADFLLERAVADMAEVLR